MSDQRPVAAELDAAAEKIRDLSGDVADCLAGGMPHDTLTYRGSLLHELCQAALTMCKGYRAKPVAAPAAVCEGKPVSCFQCGSSSVKSDFDPDVGKWFECLNCEQKWSEKQMVLTDNDIPSRAPVCEWKKLPDAIGVAAVAKYKKVIVGDNITRLPKGCYAYQKQDWAAWGVKLVDRDDEIADRGWNFIRLPDAAPPSPQRGPASVEQSEESQ